MGDIPTILYWEFYYLLIIIPLILIIMSIYLSNKCFNYIKNEKLFRFFRNSYFFLFFSTLISLFISIIIIFSGLDKGYFSPNVTWQPYALKVLYLIWFVSFTLIPWLILKQIDKKIKQIPNIINKFELYLLKMPAFLISSFLLIIPIYFFRSYGYINNYYSTGDVVVSFLAGIISLIIFIFLIINHIFEKNKFKFSNPYN